MRRRYFGRIGANKVYRGPSTVNVNIDSDQGLELAAAVIKTCKTGKPIDTVFYFTRIQKLIPEQNNLLTSLLKKSFHQKQQIPTTPSLKWQNS